MSGYFDRMPPEHIRLPQGKALTAPLAGDPLYQRLQWFTDGWLRADETDGKLVISDLRPCCRPMPMPCTVAPSTACVRESM